MTAYNRVNGTFCGHHRHLVEDVLRGEWGFDGFVMSDFALGVRGPRAVTAGMDLEMPQRMWFSLLPALVRSGAIPRRTIDTAARRLVRAQVRFASSGEPDRYRRDAVASPEHRGLAREAAARSLVLLRNEAVGGSPVLPFDTARIRRLAVVGRLAGEANLGDRGSSCVHPPDAVTVVRGLREFAEQFGVTVEFDDGSDVVRAASLAARCDAVVSVVGNTWRDEGEWVGRYGGDRRSLRLSRDHERLVRAVGAASQRHVVVLMGGSAFAVDPIQRSAGALVAAWYPGMEGGHAVAQLLFGRTEPEGRLPVTWPRTGTTLPPFRRFTRRIRYGPLHGYRLMEATGQEPAYWFGHGLSYTRFEWSPPRIVADDLMGETRRVAVEVDVTNVGERAGTEVVQLFAAQALGTEPRRLHTLIGATVARGVVSGETRTIRVEATVSNPTAQLAVGSSADPLTHRSVLFAG